MSSLGVAVLFVGAYMLYASYEAIHNHTTAAPLTKAKAALKAKPVP